jgi:hypothetical protein
VTARLHGVDAARAAFDLRLCLRLKPAVSQAPSGSAARTRLRLDACFCIRDIKNLSDETAGWNLLELGELSRLKAIELN